MAHLRIVQITGKKGEEALKVLPGRYNTDRDCKAAITEDGEYFFLEAHTLKAISKTKKKDNGNTSIPDEQEEE